MILKKTVRALLAVNALQFMAVLFLGFFIVRGFTEKTGDHTAVFFNIRMAREAWYSLFHPGAEGTTGLAVWSGLLMVVVLLLGSLLTLLALYASNRYQETFYRESMENLETLNRTLRTQRHDYLNHVQVIYGLMELGEYEEAKKYMEPVFQEISRVSGALKTAQPAVNALLQAKLESARKKGIRMQVEVGTPLKRICLEPWELCRVLANLIDNAITALEMREGEKRLEVSILQEENRYLFRVRDNGPGIPAGWREQIFRQGFTTKQGEGHGMGLYIVEQIVKEAGGSVCVPEEEAGCCFEVRLPVN